MKAGAARTQEDGPLTVLFDGECPICIASVRRLGRSPGLVALELLPFQDPSVPGRFPWIPAEALARSLHVVDPEGRSWEGAEALEVLIRTLPGWRRLSWIFRLPLVRRAARRVYGWVARNRYRGACGRHCAPGVHRRSGEGSFRR